METKGKSSLICLAVSHLIGQSLVVVKECLVLLPTTALLTWGNLSCDQLLQKACYAIKTFLTLKKLWHPKHFCVTFMYPKKQTKKMNKLNYKLRRKRLTKINEKGAVTIRMLQFTQRSTLILYLLLHRKEMSRIICLSELSHILLQRSFVRNCFSC